MHKWMKYYWEKRLDRLKQKLESNNFEVYLAASLSETKRIVQEEILTKTGAKKISWGGSKTATDIGIIQALMDDPALVFVDPFEKNIPMEESLKRRRQALLADLFITGSNAVTETGRLVNLDRTGNRIAAMTFGPKFVVLLIGRNKIVPDLEQAFCRIKEYAAPLVAMHIKAKTPCALSSYCEDCKSPDRVCNTWNIIEKSYPKGRIKVVLIIDEVGF
ncbi:MAG: lactate utilization protein [Deltaproteobacteria bacterium]|nr:lactate utilization protein [Deltaproteobacteria bacterium]